MIDQKEAKMVEMRGHFIEAVASLDLTTHEGRERLNNNLKIYEDQHKMVIEKERQSKVGSESSNSDSDASDVRLAQVEKDRTILKSAVQLLHRKHMTEKHEKEQSRRECHNKDHELNVLRQRANSNEARARGLHDENTQLKARLQQFQNLLLRGAMAHDPSLY